MIASQLQYLDSFFDYYLTYVNDTHGPIASEINWTFAIGIVWKTGSFSTLTGTVNEFTEFSEFYQNNNA